MTTLLKNFLLLSYEELEKLNLEAKKRQQNHALTDAEHQSHYASYLQQEDRIKAVSLCFSDLEGRFHVLDYDKKFLLQAYDNLTFDGSSIRGFSQVQQSDLRLLPDWASFRWLPGDIFGPGKVIMFGLIQDRDGKFYQSDMRAQLKKYTDDLYKKDKTITNVSVECEGFLFKGINAEQTYTDHFELVSSGGYFHSLPQDPLKQFIDTFAEAQRAMAFENEKDHPEVAPSQFELNYTYSEAVIAGDLLQLYKLLARQVAANMGMTASFLPKPVAGINGNGMHCNISISKNKVNTFHGKKEGGLSASAIDFIERLLHNANDMCLVLNPSVNAYRRLDPAYEAPNQIKYSDIDRTSMVRIPLGNEKSARIEVRTVAPDANPYLVFLTLLRTGLEGPLSAVEEQKRNRTRILPDNMYDALRHFKGSEFMAQILGAETKEKYAGLKKVAANRCPKELGDLVKPGEIHFHHEVTNQYIWSKF